jgi:hypothetical protein
MATNWPVYFCTRAPSVPGKRTGGMKAGDPFAWQDKETIKRFGPAFGVLDAIDRRFADLDYVTSVGVGSEAMRVDILKKNLPLHVVRRMLDGTEVAPSVEGTPLPRRRAARIAEEAAHNG